MQPQTDSREIQRDTIIERMRAMLRGLSGTTEQAFLKSMMDIMQVYAQSDNREQDEERDLWIRNEQRKALGRKELMQNSLTSSQTAKLLGIRPHALYMRIERGSILAFRDGRDFFIPQWQFDLQQSNGMVKGFDRVMNAMQGAMDENKILWLSRPYGAFEGQAPIDVLKRGDVDLVVEYAASLAGGQS